MEELYYRFSRYLKDRFGGARKITVDAGFSCPNRDGTISRDGCIYCDNAGFSPNAAGPARSGDVYLQIRQGVERLRRKGDDRRFLVYFQAFTNTHAPIERLREVYDTVRRFPGAAGICIATRPDCVPDAVLDLIDSYTRDYEVWIEYGLQSSHDATLAAIGRGHSAADFTDALERTRKRPRIRICAHVILGLPGETTGMMRETARFLADLAPDGVKVHPLHIMRGTRLAELYYRGDCRLLSMEEYCAAAADFLERTPPETVIQRITADCPDDILVAPRWIRAKSQVIRSVESLLSERGTRQGSLFCSPAD